MLRCGIVEIGESIAEGVTELGENIGTLASALGSAIQNAFSSVGSGVQSVVLTQFCNSFVSQALTCNNGSPVMSAIAMSNACMQQTASIADGALAAVCPGLAASTYALATDYCQNPNQSITSILQQSCPAS